MAVLQVRGVSAEAYERLRRRAAGRGQSLSEYLRGELERMAGELTLEEALERVRRREPVPGVSGARAVREGRARGGAGVICVDASALVDWLLGAPGRGAAVDRRLLEAGAAHTLDLAAVEVASAFRRMVRTGDMEAARAEEALGDLVVAPLRRHPATPLTARMWDLRHCHSPFDAACLALAEVLDMPLVTTDGRLARSRGHSATVLDLSG